MPSQKNSPIEIESSNPKESGPLFSRKCSSSLRLERRKNGIFTIVMKFIPFVKLRLDIDSFLYWVRKMSAQSTRSSSFPFSLYKENKWVALCRNKKTDLLLRTIGPLIFWKATLRSQQVVGFIAEPCESGSWICLKPFLGQMK